MGKEEAKTRRSLREARMGERVGGRAIGASSEGKVRRARTGARESARQRGPPNKLALSNTKTSPFLRQESSDPW